MAGKKKPSLKKTETQDKNINIAGAGEILEQPIANTLESNYMPYAMSVIMSRAIPEIDGFKPSHRKLLYTMFQMGLLKGARQKSANIVGRTMQLNPHGDAAIYETMVRLTRGNEALLHPYVDSKGNFGKAYSKNMAYAASRYTEAKLDPICEELFSDIDKDAVDLVPNYDNTVKEPVLLPVTFPSVLVNANSGIAVGMASNICSFNLREVCRATAEYIKNPDCDISETLIAPDFSSGGIFLFDKEKLDEVYSTGKGSLRIRSKYSYDKKNNCIDVLEIPPTTTCEQIIDKIIDLVKSGKVKEVSDIRDETDKTGLKITIDLKRGTDPDKLMRKLFRSTPLEDTFACNFNILTGGTPKVMGVKEIIEEWTAFRTECIKRRTVFLLDKAKTRLHLLKGLQLILLDIDKAISIIRKTQEEQDVVPNLMIGFGIDRQQADYVAEIKLRHLNREYILSRLKDIEELEKTIADMEDILSDGKRIKKIIIEELERVEREHGRDRKTTVKYDFDPEDDDIEPDVPDYPVTLFFTHDGYFKKITPQSLRMSGDHKLKDNDFITCELETTNGAELLFFTDKGKTYKSKASDFADSKTSVLGDFIPTALDFDKDENPVYMAVTFDYSGFMMFFFKNGKVAKVDMMSYYTKTNRKRLLNAYSEASPLVAAFQSDGDDEYAMYSSAGRILLFSSGSVKSKTTKNTQGVQVMTLKKGHRITEVSRFKEGMFVDPKRYRPKNIPSSGALTAQNDKGEQLKF